MDRGTMTDNRGEVLNFSNTIFCYTSNVGYSDAARKTKPIGYGDQASRDRAYVQSLEQEVRRQLSPEFMNRVTMLHFNYLSRDDAERIFDLEFSKIARRYLARQEIEVTCTDRARRRLIDTGFDRDYGARNLTTVLNHVVNIGISRRLRRDDPPGGRDVSEILEDIRKGREGEDSVDLAELERRAKEAARVRVLYRRIVVDYEDGEFHFDPR
jgi:ATP-dependent Clp protease ATP-binding subunit ClpA